MLSNNATADLITKDGKTFQNYSYKIVNAGLLISDYENDMQTLVRWENLPNDLREKYKQHEQKFIEQKKRKLERKKQRQEQDQLDKITYEPINEDKVFKGASNGIFIRRYREWCIGVRWETETLFWFLVDCPPGQIEGANIKPNTTFPSHRMTVPTATIYAGKGFVCSLCNLNSYYKYPVHPECIRLSTTPPYVVIIKKTQCCIKKVSLLKKWIIANIDKPCPAKRLYVYYIGKKAANIGGVDMLIPMMTYDKSVALKKLKQNPSLIKEFAETKLGANKREETLPSLRRRRR